MRAKTTKIHLKKRKKILKLAKGYRQARHRLYRVAKTMVMHAGMHAYNSRKQKKRMFRRLWIVRINAALRNHGMSYSQFIDRTKKAGIKLNRKSLADIAFLYPEVFDKIVEKVR